MTEPTLSDPAAVLVELGPGVVDSEGILRPPPPPDQVAATASSGSAQAGAAGQ